MYGPSNLNNRNDSIQLVPTYNLHTTMARPLESLQDGIRASAPCRMGTEFSSHPDSEIQHSTESPNYLHFNGPC